MSDLEQLFVFECKESNALKLANSNAVTRVLAAQEIEALTIRVLSVVPKQEMTIFVLPMKSDLVITIRNSLGVSLASSQQQNEEAMLKCERNVPIYISFLNNSQQSIASGTLLATCSVKQTPTVSQTFLNGFVNQVPFSPQASLQVDEFGRFLYSFLNLELVKNSSFMLCSAQNAILPGSISILPSEGFSGAFEPTSIPISIGDSVNCSLLVLESGYYSGTILVNVNGSGTVSPKNFSMI